MTRSRKMAKSPKFKSNTKVYVERWLDDEQSQKRSSRKARMAEKHKTEAKWIELDQSNAVVSEVFRKQCRALIKETGEEVLCNYRKNQIFFERAPGWRERSPVAVGDHVLVERVGSRDGIVVALSRRNNFLARPAPGREEGFVHVLLTNIDLLLIVTSVREPEFSAGLIDRFLIACQVGGVKPLIVVNKIDIEGDAVPWRVYEELGYEIVKISAKTGEGVSELVKNLQGKTVGLAGHSGVGKTTLMRILMREDVGRVGDVNAFTGKGKHTTTAARLFRSPQGFLLIDTPGIRSLGLVGVTPQTVRSYYPEFAGLPCNEMGCDHLNGECEAAKLPRYETYRRIMEGEIEWSGE